MTVTRIISGGQTGTDRGALLAARDLGLERGGWAPRGWKAEDGAIPEEFRDGMRTTLNYSYGYRTRLNVDDSDGTLILTREVVLTGGTLMTEDYATSTGSPVMTLVMVDLDVPWPSVSNARGRLHGWLQRNRIRVLNVAGPRESKAPGIQEQARAALVELLRVA